MGFWKSLRSRSSKTSRRSARNESHELRKPPEPDRLTALPDKVLTNIFHHVAPYSLDMSCEAPEQSMIPNCCGLCGLKDLHSCALTSRKCYMIMQHVLYKSIRIDPVHFCPREYELARVRLNKRIDPSSIVPMRFRLLQRLACQRPDIAADVHYLKLPYMAREALPNDLTRLVASFPNLHHIDLPAGFFAADPSLSLLREEVASKCPSLRYMKYTQGSEYAFASLLSYPTWSRLEVLDLQGIEIDSNTFRGVLTTFPSLTKLSLAGVPNLDDSLFCSAVDLASFPPLKTLKIESIPAITSAGLSLYLQRPEVASLLKSLSLKETGVSIDTLHKFLALASALEFFSVTQTAQRPFPLDAKQPLQAQRLRTLHFEVSAASTSPQLTDRSARIAKGFYYYLASSIQAGGLPSLAKLYVHDADFASLLTNDGPPSSPFTKPTLLPLQAPSKSTNSKSAIDLFTKGPDDSDWFFSEVAAQKTAHRQSIAPRSSRLRAQGRPVSAYLATEGSGIEWAGQARKSVIVANGQGGFLAVQGSAPHVEDVPRVPAIPKAFADAPRALERAYMR